MVAAAIVALLARPAQSAPVRELLLAGRLDDEPDSIVAPCIEVRCLESGKVLITRHGIDCIATDGACSLAVAIKGADISIEERLTMGRGLLLPGQRAVFDLGYLAPGYYHVHYNSAKAALWTAFTVHMRLGIAMSRQLQH